MHSIFPRKLVRIQQSIQTPLVMDKLFTRQSHSLEYNLEILQQIHPQFQTVLLDPLRPSVEKLSIVFVEHKI